MVADPQISDIIPGESEPGTATNFSVQNWLLFRKRSLDLLNLRIQLEKLEGNKGDTLGSLQSLSELLTVALQARGNPVDVRVSSERINETLDTLGACDEGGSYGNISKEHMDKLMRYCLLEKDYKEFKNEYLEWEARYDMTEASLIDWNTEEGIKAPLKTNPFLARFLNRKSLELKKKKQVQTDSQVTCEVPAHPRIHDGEV